MIKNSKILIVDDEPRMCTGLKTLLSTQNYEVQTCNSGNEALNFLNKIEFDLVILDLFMERMDGFQLIGRTMDQAIDIPMIIMTGNASIKSAVKALRMGASDYLKKPFEAEELFLSVKHALTQKVLKKENELITKKLYESEKQYRSILETMKDAACICSSDSQIQYMNNKMISRIGHDKAGKVCYKAIYNRDEKCSWCVLDQVRQGKHIEYELKDPMDNRFYAISSSPIYGSEEDISMLVVMRDITEHKIRESQLRQAHKMESIGTLSGGIAHDFNNLLYMILGHTELALGEISESNPAQSNLVSIRAASLRAAGVVKQLLNFSRKSDQDLKPINIVAIIKNTLKLLRETIPSTIEFKTQLPDADAAILGDKSQVNQLMINLCTNAFQAMEKTGGSLEINVEILTLNEEAGNNFVNLLPDTQVKISIIDTGPGIAADIIDRIFDPYFTTRNFGESSGMGLSVVLGIIKNHDATISVDSQIGQGAVFTIHFPVIDEVPAIETGEMDEIPHGIETVLIVDDEEYIVNMIAKILESLGYRVVTALHPEKALSLFKLQPDSFDLVITDLTMPHMNGIKFSEKLKAIWPDIPIIISTGQKDLIDQDRAEQIGIAGYISKPVSLYKIARIIRKVLDK